jgi:hypothetical protein
MRTPILPLVALLVGCGSGSGGTPAGSGGGGHGGTAGHGGSVSSSSGHGGDGSGGAGTGGGSSSSGADAGPDDAATDGAPLDAALPTGPVFYVATTGDDAHSGSITAPWKTISHAMSTVTAGATVMVRAGVYGEQVEVGVSGTPGSPITLQSYPGELGIIDGTAVPVVDGTGLIDIDSRSHLVISGLEIRNWTSTTSAVPAGIFVQGSSSDVQLLGNHVHAIVTTKESCNGAGGNAFGIAVYGTATTPISALVVHGNEVDHLRTGCSESLTVNGNVDGFEVSQNTVHDNDNIGIDAIGDEGTAPTSALDMARNGVIRQNTVFNITSQGNAAYNGLGADGIYVDGGKNILIEQNVVHNVDIGIELASEHAGNTSTYVLARNNVVYYSNASGASIGGYDASVGGTDHCAFVNNTFYDNVTELSMNFHITSTLYQDNLVYDAGGDFSEGSTTGVTIDHDLDLKTGAASVFVNPGTAPDGAIAVDLHVAAATLSQVQSHGIEIACPAGWTCPAVWGASLNGTADAAGNARVTGGGVDIGAYEAP